MVENNRDRQIEILTQLFNQLIVGNLNLDKIDDDDDILNLLENSGDWDDSNELYLSTLEKEDDLEGLYLKLSQEDKLHLLRMLLNKMEFQDSYFHYCEIKGISEEEKEDMEEEEIIDFIFKYFYKSHNSSLGLSMLEKDLLNYIHPYYHSVLSEIYTYDECAKEDYLSELDYQVFDLVYKY